MPSPSKSEDRQFSASLKGLLGYAPKHLELYRQAFTHSSISRTYQRHNRRYVRPVRPQHSEHNERLEFLGDAVLEIIVSEHLYSKFPSKREGFLTQLRSKIVGREALEKLAQQLNLSRFVMAKLRNSVAKNILGNTLEALMGAVYLDKGYVHARDIFLNRMLLPHVNIDDLIKREFDFKSRLLEVTQKRGAQAVFETVSQPSKDKSHSVFTSTVRINGEVAGQGSGLSKKEAEQRAAESAYGNFTAAKRT